MGTGIHILNVRFYSNQKWQLGGLTGIYGGEYELLSTAFLFYRPFCAIFNLAQR